LNQAVKRNIERFIDGFMFHMTNQGLENWKSKIVISNKEIMGLRKLPFVFTEQGVSMLNRTNLKKIVYELTKIYLKFMRKVINQ